MKRRILSLILAICLIASILTSVIYASEDDPMGDLSGEDNSFITEIEPVNLELDVKSAILMEAETGEILYESNADEALSPASVTKIMTLLLVCEALENGAIKLDDDVSVSANAASMGGSQIFLEEGETFTVEELLKCTIIASANDAAVALAELVSGSESAFVTRMNERARELGMVNTSFENCTGLDDTTENHVTSARDIALMSRELIRHPIILKYSGLWQDSIRDGQFVLTNTNRLVRYYKGCTGLKTGSTDKAGYCLSATAERDGMHLISVVMGAPTRDSRNQSARTLLDYGFSTYGLYNKSEELLESIPLKHAQNQIGDIYSSPCTALVKKENLKKIEVKYNIPEYVKAPVLAGDAVGSVSYYLDGVKLGESKIYFKDDIVAVTAFDVIIKIFSCFIG